MEPIANDFTVFKDPVLSTIFNQGFHRRRRESRELLEIPYFRTRNRRGETDFFIKFLLYLKIIKNHGKRKINRKFF